MKARNLTVQHPQAPRLPHRPTERPLGEVSFVQLRIVLAVAAIMTRTGSRQDATQPQAGFAPLVVPIRHLRGRRPGISMRRDQTG